MKKIMFGISILVGLTACGTSQTASSNQSATTSAKRQGGPPSSSEILAKMDSNKDGKLSKIEVKGPLKDDFDKIDTDKNGFISQKELESAPKPQHPPRGGGGPR